MPSANLATGKRHLPAVRVPLLGSHLRGETVIRYARILRRGRLRERGRLSKSGLRQCL